MKHFTNLYSLSKTLRFELQPIGKTLENINANGFLTTDAHRAESYKKVKKLIDAYHKDYIEKVLNEFKLNPEHLQLYFDLYSQATKDKQFKDVQDKLRKAIASALKADDRYKTIDKKELIRQDMKKFLDNDADKALLDEFQRRGIDTEAVFDGNKISFANLIKYDIDGNKLIALK